MLDDPLPLQAYMAEFRSIVEGRVSKRASSCFSRFWSRSWRSLRDWGNTCTTGNRLALLSRPDISAIQQQTDGHTQRQISNRKAHTYIHSTFTWLELLLQLCRTPLLHGLLVVAWYCRRRASPLLKKKKGKKSSFWVTGRCSCFSIWTRNGTF